jgi:DNA polymerase-3 subunit alpha
MITLEELVSRASYLKYGAVALTDHHTTYGHYEFYHLARKAGIRPILGAELSHYSLAGSRALFHLTVLAENNTGYRNLVSLVNAHYRKNGQQYVTPEELDRYSEGLIVLTGCLKGEAAQAILHGNLGRERQVVERLLEIYDRSNIFIEVMNHNLPEEELVNKHLTILSQRIGIPLVVTNNDRYVQKEEGEYFDILCRLRGGEGEEEVGTAPGEYYLKRQKDLEPFFYAVSDALGRPGEIAERCQVSLERTGRIQFSNDTGPGEHLREMCRRRFLLKFHNRLAEETVPLERLMERELESAERESMSDFLLFLRNVFATAAQQGVWLEIIGGNLYESIVAYLLGIIPLNPVEHGLVFESFAADGRTPTVELVKSRGRRDDLLQLIKGQLPEYQLYYQVLRVEMSFSTILREIAEHFGIKPDLCAELARMVMPERRHKDLAILLDRSESLRHLYQSESAVRGALHAAHALQGRINHFNMNSSRIVILPKGMEEIAAYISGANEEQYLLLNNTTIEAMGGWILIFQHSHFLSALEGAMREMARGAVEGPPLYPVDESEGGKWAPEQLDDPKTFGLVSSGETQGIYLLESQGIRDLLMQIRPANFDELVNVISLYRPRPLEGKLWQRFIENAEKKGRVYLPHASVAAATENTRGVLLFREQVSEILHEAAGLDGDRAVTAENALLNRDAGELLSARLEFIRGAMDNEINEEEAQKIFDYLLHNISYTHDKSLSCAQAYLSYRTAFFKANLFEYYFVSLLNSNMDVRERQRRYIEYLEGINIDVLPMDINASGDCFAVEMDGIRTPLRLAQSLDQEELNEILEERSQNGDFDSLRDFLNRVFGRVSFKAVSGLIEEGAFDFEGIEREELNGICRDFFEGGGKLGFFTPRPARQQPVRKKKRSSAQLSFFDSDEET